MTKTDDQNGKFSDKNFTVFSRKTAGSDGLNFYIFEIYIQNP